MVICQHCGLENRAGISFCETCGEPLKQAGAPAPVSDSGGAPGPAGAPQPAITLPTGPRSAVEPSSPADVRHVTHAPVAPQLRELGWSWALVPTSAIVGAMLVGGSAFLPWLAGPYGSLKGTGVPLALMWDISAEESAISAGVVFVTLGITGLVLAGLQGGGAASRLVGLFAAAIAVLVAVQTARFVSESAPSFHFLGLVSVGLYAAFGGGILMLTAPGKRG